jgi:hypothetical protein
MMVRKRWMRWRGGEGERSTSRRGGGGRGGRGEGSPAEGKTVAKQAPPTQLQLHSFSGTRILSRQLGTQTENNSSGEPICEVKKMISSPLSCREWKSGPMRENVIFLREGASSLMQIARKKNGFSEKRMKGRRTISVV